MNSCQPRCGMISRKAISAIDYCGSSIAEADIYYTRRAAKSRNMAWLLQAQRSTHSPDDIYMKDIIHGGIDNDELLIRQNISAKRHG